MRPATAALALAEGQRRTFVVVDGENIDATLGTSILQRRPNPEERPRWDRLTEFATGLWDQPVTGLFFINATQGQLPLPFIQALLALSYRVVPLTADDFKGFATDDAVSAPRRSRAASPSCSPTPSGGPAPRSRGCRAASSRPRAWSTTTGSPTSRCGCASP